MKFAFASVKLTPLFPIKQMGFIQQTEPIFNIHDDLFAHIIAFRSTDQIMFLISCDNLGFPLCIQEEIQRLCFKHFDLPCFVTISSTHTHFGADSNNEHYQVQCIRSIYNACKQLDFKEGDLSCHLHSEPYEEVGVSRISNHKAFSLIQLFSLFDGNKRIATLITHNCHPTIMGSDTPYFSAEYPGYLISKLKELYPHEFFLFYQGPAGDISTRFTRQQQNYNGVIQLTQLLIKKISTLLGVTLKTEPLTTFSFEKTTLNITHDLSPINLSLMPETLTNREKETIQIGIKVRKELLSNPSSLDKSIYISKVCLGPIKFIFCPNECFSYYLKAININSSILVCYSNGYSPYVTGINESTITYEKFTDTWNDETKQSFFNILQNYST